MTNTTKGGHAKTAPEAQPGDITTSLNPPIVPVAKPGDIHVESVPDEINEGAMEQAFKAYKTFVREIGRDLTKRWEGMADRYKPPHYVYYRCGLRGDTRAEFVFGELKRAGFVLAPKGTYCTLYLSDRGNGLYACIRADYHKEFHAIENALVREKSERALKSKRSDSFDALREAGIEVENLEERTETMSAEEFMGGRGGVVQKSFK